MLYDISVDTERRKQHSPCPQHHYRLWMWPFLCVSLCIIKLCVFIIFTKTITISNKSSSAYYQNNWQWLLYYITLYYVKLSPSSILTDDIFPFLQDLFSESYNRLSVKPTWWIFYRINLTVSVYLSVSLSLKAFVFVWLCGG